MLTLQLLFLQYDVQNSTDLRLKRTSIYTRVLSKEQTILLVIKKVRFVLSNQLHRSKTTCQDLGLGPVQTPRSTHVPNLTDELSTAKERRLNQFGTAVLFSAAKALSSTESVELLSNLT